ncbi:hypothetical protein ACFQ3Z_42870 [Streptomyces nogalater]
MALVFRWYFVHSTRMALRGDPAERVNYQIHTGPAIGAFNRFAAGTALADWRNRHVDAVAEALMAARPRSSGTVFPRWADNSAACSIVSCADLRRNGLIVPRRAEMRTIHQGARP